MPAVEVETKWMCSGFDSVPELAHTRDFSLLYKYILCTVTASAPSQNMYGGGWFGSGGGGEPRMWQLAHVSPEWGLESDPSHDGSLAVRAAFADASYVTVNKQETDLTARPAHPTNFLQLDKPETSLTGQEAQEAPPNPYGFLLGRPRNNQPKAASSKYAILQSLDSKVHRVDVYKTPFSRDVTSALEHMHCVVADPPTGAPVLTNEGVVGGKILIMYPPDESEGGITYLDQARRAESAGAAACLLVAFAPVTAPLTGSVNIPCFFIDKLSARRLIALPDASLQICPLYTLPPQKRQDTSEEDVLFEMYFPDFQGALSTAEGEQLACLLTAPHLAIPLVLDFFAQDRVALLADKRLQAILESVLFDPGPLAPAQGATDITHCPLPDAERRLLLSTEQGLLSEELRHAPLPLYQMVYKLLAAASDLAIGAYTSPLIDVLLFLSRVAVRLEVLHGGLHGPATRPGPSATDVDAVRNNIRAMLETTVVAKLQRYIHALADSVDTTYQTWFHGHVALIMANSAEPSSLATFLSSAAFVVSWHSKESETSNNAASRNTRRPWYDQQPTSNAPAFEHYLPTHDVFLAIERMRPKLIERIEALDREALSALLGQTAAVALQHGGEGDLVTTGWHRVSSKPLTCTKIFESSHPYTANTDIRIPIEFPGTSQIALFFDHQTRTETTYDYLTIFKETSGKDFWGEARYSGPHGWPGTDGKKPILIPADHCCVHFHSDGSKQDWGWRIVAVAPVCKAFAQQLVDECHVSQFVAETALARAANIKSEALAIIQAHRAELEAEEAEATKHDKQDQGLESRGVYKDPSGSLEVNIQTAEVYVQNRMLMPCPSDVVADADFTSVFGAGVVPNCSVIDNLMNVKKLSVITSSNVYTVEAWLPQMQLSLTDALNTGSEGSSGGGGGGGALGLLRQSTIVDDESTVDSIARQTPRCVNMPLFTGKGLEFLGRTFVPYLPKSCGWASDLFDTELRRAQLALKVLHLLLNFLTK